MASCFRKSTFWSILSLVCLAGCGVNGGVALLEDSSDVSYDGVVCDTTVTSNLSSAAFEALLQNGTSDSDRYTVCIAEGVSITGRVSISQNFLHIQGEYLESQNIIGGMAVGNNTNVTLSKMQITSTGAFPRTINVDVANANTTLGITKSVVTGEESPISASVSGGSGSFNVTVDQTQLTTENGSAIEISSSGIGTNATATLTSNVFRAQNTSSGMSSAGVSASNSGIGSSVVVNGSSTKKNLVCNMSGSVYQFNSVYSGSFSGTLSAASFSNPDQSTVTTCP